MKTIKNRTIYYALPALILSGLVVFTEVGAHGGATGVVKERMDLMKSMGDQMKTMGEMMKGKRAFDAAAIANSALDISRVAPEINHLFPQGSLHKPSEALPRIWQERDQFDELTRNMIKEADKLSNLASTGERRSILIQFTRLGKTCSSCHTDFRKKQKD